MLKIRILGNEEILRLFTMTFHWLYDSWTRGLELVTRGCELVTRGFELVTRTVEFVTREFEIVDFNSHC